MKELGRPHRVPLLAMLLTIAACGQQADERGGAFSTADPLTPAHQPPLQPVTSFAGEWRVVAIDGRPLEESSGLSLSADERNIWAEPRCMGLVRVYAIMGLRLSVTQPVSEAPPLTPGATPPPVCLVMPPPRLQDVRRALDAATRIGRTPDDGVHLSGGGHSLLLFAQ